VIDAYLDGSLVETLRRRGEQKLAHELPPEEAAVLVLLQERLKCEAEEKQAAVKAS
jgi:DNA topoisomerase-1